MTKDYEDEPFNLYFPIIAFLVFGVLCLIFWPRGNSANIITENYKFVKIDNPKINAGFEPQVIIYYRGSDNIIQSHSFALSDVFISKNLSKTSKSDLDIIYTKNSSNQKENIRCSIILNTEKEYLFWQSWKQKWGNCGKEVR